MSQYMGLKQRIQNAADQEQLDYLMKQAADYQVASDKTRRQWGRAYDVRHAELTQQAFKAKSMQRIENGTPPNPQGIFNDYEGCDSGTNTKPECEIHPSDIAG